MSFNYLTIELCCDPIHPPNFEFKMEIPNSIIANQDLKGMDFLCTFKMKIESQNSKCGCIKDSDIHKSRSRCKTPVKNLQSP